MTAQELSDKLTLYQDLDDQLSIEVSELEQQIRLLFNQHKELHNKRLDLVQKMSTIQTLYNELKTLGEPING